MNLFQKEIIKTFSQFNENDFNYFNKDSYDKVNTIVKRKCPRILNVYKGAKDSDYNRSIYCLLNCGFKCLDEKI